jgi:hypothetical protein
VFRKKLVAEGEAAQKASKIAAAQGELAFRREFHRTRFEPLVSMHRLVVHEEKAAHEAKLKELEQEELRILQEMAEMTQKEIQRPENMPNEQIELELTQLMEEFMRV